MIGLPSFLRAWRDLRRFKRLDAARRRIVFYSEDASYWGYFKPVVDSLLEDHGRTICYLTSDADDPLPSGDDPRIDAFYVGTGGAMIYMFQTLQAGIMVMTLPDLGTFHVERSRHPVHYVHLLHSMVSTHMIYRSGAFDHFDSVMCTGPHQVAEIRRWEELEGLPAKGLFEHGYGPLDTLMAAAGHPATGDGLHILVAPSWGPQGLLETCGGDLVKILLDAGHRVTVRPHPRTRQLTPKAIDGLAARFHGHPRFALDADISALDSLLGAHLMVSDWSGVAMEFVFGLERPVVFIDLPRKVNNPQYERLDATPLEVAYRRQAGAVVAPERLDEIPALARSLCADPDAFAARAGELRKRWVFNPGKSGDRGAGIIAGLADGLL